eukprot:CAMPEP_0119396646 /NCGR_PEP_ID=MMETSP1334-20130426/137736_1 /TAXON_ID=127549 /ORGANISM="Calcidiscus leptoporus, Strain RCC1130" /LENGTH=216 /DNA_ID=CAMNT_0007420343 /DNA_START=31 /DNA_END=677 /DNA_ORIENTATION=+
MRGGETPFTAYTALEKPPTVRSGTIAALAAVSLIAGLANGFNATLLEGAIPRLWQAGVISSTWQAGTLAAALSLGGLSGSIACTQLSFYLSRRAIVCFGEATIMTGAALFAAAPSFAQVLVGRVLCGVGVGICGLSKPLIVSELAPAHLRGVLVSLFAVGQSVGLNVFYVVDFALPPATVEWAWRVLVALGASPALVVVLLALLTPASAYWDVAPV